MTVTVCPGYHSGRGQKVVVGIIVVIGNQTAWASVTIDKYQMEKPYSMAVRAMIGSPRNLSHVDRYDVTQYNNIYTV